METGAGVLQITHLGDAVSVAMGGITDHGAVELRLAATTLSGRFVSLGNPHFVVYGQWTREDALRLGPQAERHRAFPEGVNVSFATLTGDQVVLFVWERGCGLTMACGTGACATAAVGWLEGHLTPTRDVTIKLPGGQLQLGGTPDALEMRGAATLVFTGVV
jgi:diaminopimelate epimerase